MIGKLKVSKKQIKENSNKILAIGYCSLQALLHYSQPFAYSAGSCGWACDYYDIDNVVISTGYSTIGESVNHDLVKEYEQKASTIVWGNYSESYESKKEKVTQLLSEFIKKVV